MLNRRLTQFASLIALHSSWGPEFKWLCVPVLSCHSCALSWFACPVGVFVHYSGYHLFPLLALGTVLLAGALVGRLFCGWVCPFGFLQDMLHKIPGPKFTLPRWAGAGKYLVLVLGVFLFPFFLGEETMYSFCRVCPASALQVTIPNLMLSGFAPVSVPAMIKLGVLLAVVLLVILSSRAFCTAFCPIGAFLAPLNHISGRVVPLPSRGCVSCRKCDTVCPTGINPSGRAAAEIPVSREAGCIVCHDCRKVCPRDRETEERG